MSAFSYYHNHPAFLLDSSTPHIPILSPPLELEEYITSCSSPATTTTSASSLFPLFQYPEEEEGNMVSSSAALEIMEGVQRRIMSSSDGGSCLTSLQPRAISKSRKQKQPMMMMMNGVGGDADHDLKQAEAKKKKKPRAADHEKKQEPPEGYIHVRARRGQATDSHSLAERVRRERISERMKLLQALVPGCERVTGKALMLDEIINYVQSLQNQVEFLSMKLASVNPVLYDVDVDFYVQMGQVEKLEALPQAPQLLPPLHQANNPFHQRANGDVVAATYPIMDTSQPFLLHGQGPMAFPSQDNGSLLMQADDQRQGLLNQALLNSNCSF